MLVILLLFGLFGSACQNVDMSTKNVHPLFQRFLPTPFFPKNVAVKSKNFLRYSHHSQKKKEPAPAQIRNAKETPILWTRIRAQFKLDYPTNHPRVQQYIREFSKNNVYLNQFAKKANPYLFFITEELEKRGLPGEIALLPMIESAFEPTANSKSGAQGLWQIMPATGKFYGLEENYWYNGRQDIYASTIAAQNYLLTLHKRFAGDWLLALAAYNSGEGKVMRAIAYNKKRHLPTDFWSLKLPQETRDYVPKLLALATIIKSPATYKVILPPIENQPVFEKVEIETQIDFLDAAKLANIPKTAVQQLNPGYFRQATSNTSPSYLLLPKARVSTFKQKLKETSAKNLMQAHRHLIKPGESLSVIAKKHKTTVNELKVANQLKTDAIQAGKYLIIPTMA